MPDIKSFFTIGLMIALPLSADSLVAQGVSETGDTEMSNTVSTDVLGYWSGVYSLGRGSMTFEATLLDQVGELSVSSRNWEGVDNFACRYLLDVTSTEAQGTIDGSGGDGCPEKMSMTFSRYSPDEISIKFLDGPLAVNFGIDDIVIPAALRPFLDNETPADITNLDVVGVRTGMTQEEAASVLASKDYISEEPDIGVGEGFTSTSVTWSKGDDPLNDEIILEFTSQVDGNNSPSEVMAISRYWFMGESSNVTIASLHNAALEKYGQEGFSETLGVLNWTFARDGSLVENVRRNETCGTGPKFSIPEVMQVNGIHMSMPASCLATIDVEFDDVLQNPTFALFMRTRITDVAREVNNFWNIWAHQNASRIKSEMEQISTAVMPEL